MNQLACRVGAALREYITSRQLESARAAPTSIMFYGQKTAQVRSGLHTEGLIALQHGKGTVKFRKVQIKPL